MTARVTRAHMGFVGRVGVRASRPLSIRPEVMGIHVDDARTSVSSVALDLSLWDPSTVTNVADVPDINAWKTYSTFADASGVGLSRGQNDPNGFGSTLAATVEGGRPNLESLADLAQIRVIRCTVDATVAHDRITRRAEASAHRAAHADHDLLKMITAEEYSLDSFIPISLDVPTLMVDTTRGYDPEPGSHSSVNGERFTGLLACARAHR